MKKNMMNVVKGFLSGLTGGKRFAKGDALLLKMSLMLAAMDGEIGEDEVARFKEYAAQCRGYNETSFDALWEKTLRSAGYLLLQAHFLRQDELVAAFVEEAKGDFVDELALETREERDRAFAFLERMAQADGDFSEVERASIAALLEAVRAARDQMISLRYSRAATYDAGNVSSRM